MVTEFGSFGFFGDIAVGYILSLAVDSLRAEKDLESFAEQTDETQERVKELQEQLEEASEDKGKGFSVFRAAVTTTTKALGAFSNAAAGFFNSFSNFGIVREYSQFSREADKLRSSLRAAGKEGQQLTAVQNDLFRISKLTGTSIAVLGDQYRRFDIALQDTNASSAEIIRIIESVTKAAAAAGVPAFELGNTVRHLSRAFVVGKLQGQAFFSALKVLPDFFRIVAENAGIAFEDLSDFASEGKITTPLLRISLADFAPEAERLFSLIEPALERQFAGFGSSLSRIVDTSVRTLRDEVVGGGAGGGLFASFLGNVQQPAGILQDIDNTLVGIADRFEVVEDVIIRAVTVARELLNIFAMVLKLALRVGAITFVFVKDLIASFSDFFEEGFITFVEDLVFARIYNWIITFSGHLIGFIIGHILSERLVFGFGRKLIAVLSTSAFGAKIGAVLGGPIGAIIGAFIIFTISLVFSTFLGDVGSLFGNFYERSSHIATVVGQFQPFVGFESVEKAFDRFIGNLNSLDAFTRVEKAFGELSEHLEETTDDYISGIDRFIPLFREFIQAINVLEIVANKLVDFVVGLPKAIREYFTIDVPRRAERIREFFGSFFVEVGATPIPPQELVDRYGAEIFEEGEEFDPDSFRVQLGNLQRRVNEQLEVVEDFADAGVNWRETFEGFGTSLQRISDALAGADSRLNQYSGTIRQTGDDAERAGGIIRTSFGREFGSEGVIFGEQDFRPPLVRPRTPAAAAEPEPIVPYARGYTPEFVDAIAAERKRYEDRIERERKRQEDAEAKREEERRKREQIRENARLERERKREEANAKREQERLRKEQERMAEQERREQERLAAEERRFFEELLQPIGPQAAPGADGRTVLGFSPAAQIIDEIEAEMQEIALSFVSSINVIFRAIEDGFIRSFEEFGEAVNVVLKQVAVTLFDTIEFIGELGRGASLEGISAVGNIIGAGRTAYSNAIQQETERLVAQGEAEAAERAEAGLDAQSPNQIAEAAAAGARASGAGPAAAAAAVGRELLSRALERAVEASRRFTELTDERTKLERDLQTIDFTKEGSERRALEIQEDLNKINRELERTNSEQVIAGKVLTEADMALSDALDELLIVLTPAIAAITALIKAITAVIRVFNRLTSVLRPRGRPTRPPPIPEPDFSSAGGGQFLALTGPSTSGSVSAAGSASGYRTGIGREPGQGVPTDNPVRLDVEVEPTFFDDLHDGIVNAIAFTVKSIFEVFYRGVVGPVGGFFSAIGDFFSDLFGFQGGGFTGRGPSNQIAGLVHRNEFVLPPAVTSEFLSGSSIQINGRNGGVNVINVLDPSLLNSYLATRAGQQQIVNVIRANGPAIRSALR